MTHDWNGILWPSLGYPQGIDVGGEAAGALTVIVLDSTGGEAPQAEHVSALLHPVTDLATEIIGAPVHLQCIAVVRTRLDRLDRLGRWPLCVTQQTKAVWRLDFQVPPIPLPEMRRTVLCDLEVQIDGTPYARPGAVFLRRHQQSATTILLATDIHVARRWEWIEEDVRNVFPTQSPRRYDSLDTLTAFEPAEAWSRECFLHSFVNPNRNFASFIQMANRLAERGLIDCVWLTGDLVDFTFSRPKADTRDAFEHTEWHFLKELMLGKTELTERLCVPTYTLTGNHDRRLYPYHLQTYGLRHCGIADEVTEVYLRRVGAWRRLKYRASDLDAIRIDKAKNHALHEYHREFNPTTDYRVDFEGLKVVALDTGPDFFCDFSHLRGSRRRRFLQGIRDSLTTPYSNGFSKQQIQYFKDVCGHDQQVPLLVMAHTPLLNPYVKFDDTNGLDAEVALPLQIDERFAESDNDTRCVQFEEETARAKLDNGTVFQNSLSFLKTVQTYEHQVVVLSGHNHEQIELGLEKQRGQFYQSDYSRNTNLQYILSSRALLLQTPSLGHLKMKPTKTGFPAYRTIIVKNRSIESLNVDHLGSGDADFWFYDWEMTGIDLRDTLTLTFTSSREALEKNSEYVHKVILWRRPRRDDKSGHEPIQMVIPDDQAGAVLALEDHQLPAQGGYIVLLSRDVPSLRLGLTYLPAGVCIAFLFETFENRGGKYVSLGLKRHHRDLRAL